MASVPKSPTSAFSRRSTFTPLPTEASETDLLQDMAREQQDIQGSTFVSNINGSQGATDVNGHGVHFASSVVGGAPVLGPLKGVSGRKPKGPALDLRSRLYDRPENSQALVTVMKQGRPSSGNKVRVPRPPSGKASVVPGTAFKTTMFKSDHSKRQTLLKHGPSREDTNSSEPALTINLLHRRPSKEQLAPLPSRPTPPPIEDGRISAASAASAGDIELSVTPLPESILSETLHGRGETKKTVTFGDINKSREEVFSPDELPSMPTTPKPLSPIVRAPRQTDSPESISESPRTSSAATSRPLSATHGTSKLDPNLVLTYLKKNIYDDTEDQGTVAATTWIEPENDSFTETLIEMRRKLGWVVKLPRHSPGCAAKMEKLQDYPDPKENLEAALAAKKDDGQFVYALERNREDTRGRYNPYELQVVSPHIARASTVYWTASASNVNRIEQTKEGGEESTGTRALQWLWERRLFYMVHELPVFVKFRKWKAFVQWRNNVRNQNSSSSQVVLSKTLFAANEVLQGCLLHVRSLCEAASSSLTGVGESDAAISLVDLDKNITMTLGEFILRQKQQAQKSLTQLNTLRNKVIDIVWESCATVAEMEGVTHGIRPDDDKKAIRLREKARKKEEQGEVKYKIKTKYGDIPVFEKKNQKKKNKPTYAQIAEWRKVLHRLSFFLKSVDYLLLELLRRLVITATKTLLKFVVASFQAGADGDEEESSQDDQESVHSGSTSRTGSTMRVVAPKLSLKPTATQGRSLGQSSKENKGIQANPLEEQSGYVVPHYDFDKPEEVEKPPDIDEVLEEIEHQNEVVEIPEPILSLQLVLEVPRLESQPSLASRRASKAKTDASGSSRRRKSSLHPLADIKKAVKFSDQPDEDSDDSDYEYESETESSFSEDDNQNRNRFAYPDDSQRPGTQDASQKQAKVVLAPSEDDVQLGFRGIVSGFENTVAQVVSMLREPKLAVFYSPPKHDLKLNYDEEQKEEEEEDIKPWPDTVQIFGDDPDYQALISEVMEYITTTTESVKEYSAEFEKYCKMVDRAKRVDVEGSMAKQAWSTDEFHHVLGAHAEQLIQMEKMTKERRLGFTKVHSEGFCQSCLPYPKDVLRAVCNKLPVIAYKRNEDLLTIIKGASRRLDKYPSSVEEFVDHLSFLGKMSSELPALEREYTIVTKLYTIAKDFEVEVHPEELALYQTLAPSFQHLKTVILYAEAKKDDNIRKFSIDLETLIHNIRFKINDIKDKVRDEMLLHHDTMAVVALDTVHQLTEEVTELTTKARSYANYQERFGSSLTSQKRGFGDDFMSERKEDNSAQVIQTDLSEIERDLTLRRLLWESQEEWDKLSAEWTSNPFDSLNVESLQKNVNRFTQTVYMLEKGLPHNEVVPRLKEKVIDFKQIMPVVTSLRNPSLKPRHWEQIEKIIGRMIMRDKTFTLGNILELNIIKHKEKIQDISTTASNEATLERMLQKVIDIWKVTDFRLVPHGNGLSIIAGADDIVAQLEESQVTVGTIRGSRYVTPIKGIVEEWERRLAVFARTLDEWMTCQRNWLYLEQIFTTPDIQRQLPIESKLFATVDKSWKDIMRKTEDKPNALRASTAPGVLEMLQSANTNLEKIQKCLEDYLESKRLVFPRFYFLSNEELLDILAQSKNPDAVQPHLGKCFGNIKSLEIKTLPRQPPTVRTITSAEGEVISMPKNVRARGPVEQWLGSVEMGMFDTVKKHLKMGLQDWVGIPLDVWVLKHPGQVVLTVAQVMFNKDVTGCFGQFEPRRGLAKVRDNMIETLNVLAGLVSSNLVPHKRMSINALLTINVHNRDIIIAMIENHVTKKDDFEWMRQLRYEWDEHSNNCNVLQSNATFLYGYEYLGCSPRLVITPLTDRCYLTLTGALHLHLGGSPAGPAGTGKTETVKDLAKSMGKQCVVFNCSEGLDYKMLGKFFSGLAQSGSWCCFDEFNRIDVEVLSVVAQQIHTIKTAKDARAPRFMFESRDIRLNPTCGFFITMNPSYAGRVELPDNLKSLFRSVAMMVPDYALIAEIMLFSEGFTAAKSLSTKIVNLYQLASKQLSQQDHYDFGMRAIKSVLVIAGQKKRQVLLSISGEKRRVSQLEESHILIHSLRDTNLPKFLAEDVPLFESILSDLFPGVEPPQQDQEVLEKAISMSIRDQGLQHWPSQIEKVKQLHSQIMVRHGVMLVGPTGGGKTTIRNLLQRALVLLPTISLDDDGAVQVERSLQSKRQSIFVHNRAKKGHVETFCVNPKCVKLGELYGETDPFTFEWTDGLIATATRRFAKELLGVQETIEPEKKGAIPALPALTVAQETPRAASVTTANSQSPAPGSESGEGHGEGSSVAYSQAAIQEGQMDSVPTDWRWIILDGPVDTIWVENLNTVLDDSKILCLANGERVALANGMRLLFEVDDLSQASPATISRCAMVYMDPVDLGWRPYVKTWVSRLSRDIPESGKQHLQALFDHSIERGLAFVRQNAKEQMMPTPELSIVACLCNILSAFFDFMAKNGGFGNPDKEPIRPTSTESESSHSRSSSRTGSRADKQARLKRKLKGKQTKKDELQSIGEKRLAKNVSNDGKQYFLERNPGSLVVLLGKLFVFAFTWSFGGNFRRIDDMDDDQGLARGKASMGDKRDAVVIDIATDFDNFVHEVFEVEPPLGVRLPASSKTIYSYFVDMDTGNFIAWEALVQSTQSLIEKGAVITIGETMGVSGGGAQQKSSQDVDIVPTVDTVRYSFLMGLLLVNKNPVLLTGESGVGKTAVIKHLLDRLGKEGGTSTKSGTILGSIFNFQDKNQTLLENISSLTRLGGEDDDENRGFDLVLGATKSRQTAGLVSSVLQFSAQTSAARTQQALTQRLIKKGRDTMGAPKGKKVAVFMDDLNMPAPEEYGAQPPLELLRQYLDLGGFYDIKKLVWKDILDVTLISACGPPGGGRNPISPRLLKHFCMLALPQPSTRSLQHIYQVQLGRFFGDRDFMPDVKECLFSLVSASIAIYYHMCSSMRPTPAKIHYTFNIRDLSKVVGGLLQADEMVIVNSDNCAQLLAHEATRVFHDRLVDSTDRKTFYKILSDHLHDFFKVKWSPEKLLNEPVVFTDFMEVQEAGAGRIYRPVSDRKKLTATLEEFYMRQTIGNTQAPQIVFFKEAVEHIVRAARVFRQPGGHMLMVGLDGTGKSTTVQLAGFIANCEIYKLTLSRAYNNLDFREDIKKVCHMSGVKGLNTVFLLTDKDILKESFLEDVNSILNSGEVPDLFDNEEMDGIAMELKGAAAEAQIPDTRVAVYGFFIQRVKQNLHIVLTMSPAGNKFRQRCRMNPSLINCCTIDWYNEWDHEAMLSVAQVYFQNADFVCEEGQDLKALKDNVAEVCVAIHNSVGAATKRFWEEMRRHYYVTPSSYMELIRVYSRMLEEKKKEVMGNRDRLLVGLSRLSEANSLVGTMQEELVQLGPKIQEKAKDTEKLLAQLEKDQEAVDEVRAIVEAEEVVMKKETQVVQDYADECQRDLASVLPALQSAIESLDSLDKADISEIRMYISPPTLVKVVMSAVCVLLQEKPDWATAKLVLGDNQFLKRLINFDKNAVPEKTFKKLKIYSKEADFNPDAVGRVSDACKSMCQWVLALEHYHEVYKMAKPKQKRVEEAKEALTIAQQNLAQKQGSLLKIQDHLKMLQQQYQDSVNQRESLKERSVLTRLRLERASVLIMALSDEKVRWHESVDELDFKLKGLVGDTLVSAAAVAYLGAFTAQYRKDLLSNWVKKCLEMDIPMSAQHDLVKTMIDANQVLRWNNEGLPQDTHSTENAIIVKKSRRWPLLIDPQGQACKWIKEMEGVKLKVVQASDPNYMRTLERAIRVGEPVLLQEVTENLDPSLTPILLQDTFVRGGHRVIKIGDTEIEYNDNFRLYLATSMGNLHYLPAVCIMVSLINFTVTFDGLQEQLLSSVVKQERPQLEMERSQLLESIANDFQLLRDLEDKTLGLLQNTQGHILDDQDLVETLQQSKGMSEEIIHRVGQSEETEKELSQARKKYLPVATRGAVLYFVLADMANVDIMYQFSLSWFQDMFITCIGNTQGRPMTGSVQRHSGTVRPVNTPSTVDPKQRHKEETLLSEADLNKHMKKMIDRLTSSVFRVVSIALFAHHQLMFSFMLCSSIMRAATKYSSDDPSMAQIEDLEWQAFLQGRIMADMMDKDILAEHDGLSPIQRLEYQSKGMIPVRPRWITDTMWKQCQHFEATMEVFEGLCRSIVNNIPQWKLFAKAESPYVVMATKFDPSQVTDEADKASARQELFPWESLSSFQRIMLVKVLRPAMLTAGVRTFVEQEMGSKFLSTGAFDIREVYEESSARTPLIFILSPGSDPAAQLLRFAKELRGSTLHLDMISLGQGQGPKAEELISKAQILKGRWLFLQNCHLAASWMPKLQAIVDDFSKTTTDVDPQFRLWLSSKPDPCFPISILQTGLKMTVQPPQGVKGNMLRSFGGTITDKHYEEAAVSPAWHNLIFGLCFFNAVLHERKKYGTLGWNIPYEFNDSDLEVSLLQLKMLLAEESEIPWPALCYLTGEVTYGGRVTDDWDRRCLHSMLKKFYHPAALEPGYYYTSDKMYHPLPQDFTFLDARAYINGLPNSDTPELFGMNMNAERAHLEYQAQQLVDIIASVQPRLANSVMGSHKSSDEMVLEIAADIMGSLPENVDGETDDLKPGQQPKFSLADVAKLANSDEVKKDKQGNATPAGIDVHVIGQSALFTVLRQEIDRFNTLLEIIHRSLRLLCLAVKGEIVMSEGLEEAYNALLSQKVPVQWKQAAYESCKPLGPWVRDLIQRVDFFGHWSEQLIGVVERQLKPLATQPQAQAAPGPTSPTDELTEPTNRYQPRSFWLSAFFFPQGFLMAVLQNHARKLGVSVDSLTFEYQVMNTSETEDQLNDVKRKMNIKDLAFKGPNPPGDGVLIFGLYLDGARWNLGSGTLTDSLPGQRFCRIPEIHFLPVMLESHRVEWENSRPSTSSTESPLTMFKTRTPEEEQNTQENYECPLYRTSTRAGTLSSTGHSTNFVTSVKLPSDHHPEFWVMRGVAMLCQLDD